MKIGSYKSRKNISGFSMNKLNEMLESNKTRNRDKHKIRMEIEKRSK